MKAFVVKNEDGEVMNFESECPATQEEIDSITFGSDGNRILFAEKSQAESEIYHYLKPFTKMMGGLKPYRLEIFEIEIKIVI